jgi:predicted esterase
MTVRERRVAVQGIAEQHLSVRRTARLATIGARSTAARDVWVVCHGFGHLARTFIQPFKAIEREDRLIVAPEALNRYYLDTSLKPHGPDSKIGATWMTREDRENEITDYVAYLDDVCDWVFAEVPYATAKLTVLGFSQGVATVARWLARGRTRADNVILWGGALPDDIPAGAIKKALSGRAVTVVAGSTDEFATPERVKLAVAALEKEGVTPKMLSFEGGHVIDGDTLVSIAG